MIVGLAVFGIADAQDVPGLRRPDDDVWGNAGDVRTPANRAAVVAELRLLAEARKADAVERARRLGLPVRVDLPSGAALELMEWDGERPLYYTTYNADAAISTGSNLIRVSPYAADGSGWTVGIWDGGAVRSTHQEFSGRVTVKDGAANYNHATHVGGTIGAFGVSNNAIGMARAVRIDSYEWNSDYSEMSSRGASYGGELGKIYVSNHSYGYSSGWVYTGTPIYTWYGSGTTAAGYEDDFGKYHSVTRDLDTLAHNLPYYSIFWAAGNDRGDNSSAGTQVALSVGGSIISYDTALHPPGDAVYRGGYDTISFAGLAKNVITVGAVNDAVTSSARDVTKATMTSFSTWGPTDDGRIKPDVVANGASLYSTTSGGDANYGYMSGTSMASPNAAGSAQQLLGYYTAQLPGQYLRASSLKGLLIHTADDLGTAGPDYKFGWGLINAKAAADWIAAVATNPAVPQVLENQLSTSVTTRSHSFFWDGVSPIRATLCWTDPAAGAITTHDNRVARLINNLNLRIVGPTGTQHFPYVMPFVGTWTVESMSAAATTGTNNTDNVEQVDIASPTAAGVYQVVVSFSGALSTSPQNYSLLLSGAAAIPPNPQTVTPDVAETGIVSLTITGENFVPGSTVVFVRADQSNVAATVSSATPTNITCTLDVTSMATGLWGVRVTNPDGISGTLSSAFAVVGSLLSQDFDPDAPGWSANASAGSTYWALTSVQSHTPPNSFFALGPASKNTDNLVSEAFTITPTAQRLLFRFWHKYDLQTLADGGVLEFSINDGAYVDVTASGSGAMFVSGAYAATLGKGVNDLAGRLAWTGNSGSSFSEVVVSLDQATFGGKTLRARWRLGTDNKTASAGWYVDSVRITGYDTSNLLTYWTLGVAASPAEGGSVTGAGIYEDGTYVAITASPSNNWTFTGWTGSGIIDPTVPSTTVLVDADKNVSATFARRPPTVILVR